MSAANNYQTLLTNLSIEANKVDPDRSSLIWAHIFCHRGFLNIQQTKKQTFFVLVGTLRVNNFTFQIYGFLKACGLITNFEVTLG